VPNPKSLPNLSRFELQCLRLLWDADEATVRDLHDRIEDAPTYSTVRKIVERLEDKGAIERVRRDGAAWVYRPTVARKPFIRREIRRFLEGLFDGSARPLVAHLAEMDALTLEDLREIEMLAAGGAEGPETAIDAAEHTEGRDGARSGSRAGSPGRTNQRQGS
jgi:predicted transcriptional regulator